MKHYYTVKNNDLIIFSQQDGIKTTSAASASLKKMMCHNEAIVLSPAPYNHWTLKEIHEQKDTLLRATNNGARIHLNKIKLGGVDMLRDYIREIETIVLVGCGTSLHACQIGVFYLKKFQQLGYGNVNHICSYDAAEFSALDIPKKGKTLVIMISQSGETMDLHRILPFVKERGCLTMGIINVVDSLIAREVDCGIYMNAGRENAVASTKSFTSSLMILKLFSIWFYQEICISDTFTHIDSKKHNTNNILGGEFTSVCQNIRNVVEQVGKLNEIYKYNCDYPFNDDYPFNECDKTIYNNNERFTMLTCLNKENLFILGKGRMECIAKEAALKLKEICYIHAEAYSGSALKHGPFALLTEGFPVIFLIDKENKDKMWNAYQEVKSRRAYCLVISELDLPSVPAEQLIKIPENGELQEILYMVTLQHICYSLSQLRGINPDTPRNLAKVVTVE
jgi:glucosamine--fructose-6-phosphate aminotransferase (isomerizing)